MIELSETLTYSSVAVSTTLFTVYIQIRQDPEEKKGRSQG